MTLSRKQLGRLAIACVIGLVCLTGSRIGYAERAHKPRYERCTGQAVTLVIVGDRGAADLSVAINRLTTIVFPHPIGDVKFPRTDAFDIYQLQDNTLLVWPLDLADVGDVITVSASTTSTDLRFRFSVVDDPLTATTVAMVMEQPRGKGKVAGAVCLPLDWQSAMSALQAGIIAHKDARIDELQTELDELKAQSIKQAEKRARVEAQLAMETSAVAVTDILAKLLADREVMPINDRDPRQHGMLVHGVAWQKVDGTYYLVYEIENRDPRAFRVAGLQVFDDLMIKNHAGEAVIGDRRQKGALLAIIEPGELVRGIVAVHEPMSLGKSVSVILSEPDGGQPPVVRRTLPLWDLTPPPHENEGKMSVDLQAVYGAIWLANPLDDKQLDPTSLAGLGARITYGMSKRISVEAELMGARTGEAGFQVMDGELMRRAVLGRVQGGILARFGQDRYRPFMRLGLGLQGASHTAEMLSEDGSRMPGPNVAFEVDMTINIGAGLDLRLGEHFFAGAAVSGVAIAGDLQTIETGIHLGYNWKP